MITRLSQFFSVLAVNRHGFSAKSPGYRKGTIQRRGASPAEVVYEVLSGLPARSQSGALTRLFSSEKRQAMVAAAADAPSLLYLYQRLFASTWRAKGKQAALRVDNEWRMILSVRGQMLKVLGIKDPLRGDNRLPGTLFVAKKEDKVTT